MTESHKATIAKQFIEALPHSRALGLCLRDIGDGMAEMALPYDARFVGDPSTGVLAGGVVTALLDTCAGASVLMREEVTAATATLDLRIDYMRAAEPGRELIARAECYRVTKSVAFVRAEAWTDSRDRPVATAAGAFTVATGAATS
ncbi:MAG: PaaI family thioesterase [Pseudomonadota bacterium]